jgi:hypothetical protein
MVDCKRELYRTTRKTNGQRVSGTETANTEIRKIFPTRLEMRQDLTEANNSS